MEKEVKKNVEVLLLFSVVAKALTFAIGFVLIILFLVYEAKFWWLLVCGLILCFGMFFPEYWIKNRALLLEEVAKLNDKLGKEENEEESKEN